MKRDPELLRQLLRQLEDDPGDYLDFRAFKIEGRSGQEVRHHLELLTDAGFIVGVDTSLLSERSIISGCRLTNTGHEFLALSRNDTTWKKAQNLVMSTTGAIGLALLKEALSEMGHKAMKEGAKALGYGD